MSKRWSMPFLPGRDGAKIRGVYLNDTATITPPTVDEIVCYAGDNVPLRVQSTMVDGWKWLYEGVKSRNLLDSTGAFAGAILFSGAPWDQMTINQRKTESLISTITEDFIFIGMGANVTTNGDVNYLEDAFKRLSEFALEETLKAA